MVPEQPERREARRARGRTWRPARAARALEPCDDDRGERQDAMMPDVVEIAGARATTAPAIERGTEPRTDHDHIAAHPAAIEEADRHAVDKGEAPTPSSATRRRRQGEGQDSGPAWPRARARTPVPRSASTRPSVFPRGPLVPLGPAATAATGIFSNTGGRKGFVTSSEERRLWAVPWHGSVARTN